MILHKYWQLARAGLPQPERERIEFFEKTLPRLKGRKLQGGTHEAVIGELNTQIKAAWPKDAGYQPYALVADEGTYFTWKPNEMGNDLEANVKRFLRYHRSLAFYEGDQLRVGDPRAAKPHDKTASESTSPAEKRSGSKVDARKE